MWWYTERCGGRLNAVVVNWTMWWQTEWCSGWLSDLVVKWKLFPCHLDSITELLSKLSQKWLSFVVQIDKLTGTRHELYVSRIWVSVTQKLSHLLNKMYLWVKVTRLVNYWVYRVLLTQFWRVLPHIDSKTESICFDQSLKQCDAITVARESCSNKNS